MDPMKSGRSKALDFYDYLLLGFFLLYLIMLNFYKIQSNDTWWHLALGKHMVETGQILFQDIFSGTIEGRAFVAHEWLSEVIFYLVSGDDAAGLSLFRIAMVLGSFGFILAMILPKYKDIWVTYPVLMILGYLFTFRAHVRPQVIGLFCVTVLIFGLERWRTKLSIKAIWWLVPLQIFWANTHGSYMFGVLFMAIYAVCFGLSNRANLQAAVRLLALSGVLLLASLINPYGVHLWALSFDIFFHSQYLKDHIYEWQNVWDVGKGHYWFYLWVFWMALCWMVTIVNWRKASLMDVALLSLSSLLPSFGMRHISISTLVSLPILMRHGQDVLHHHFYSLAVLRRPKFMIILLAPLVLGISTWGTPFSPKEYKPMGLGFNQHQVPNLALRYIKDHNLEGVIMNHYGDGGYFIYHTHPQVKPTMDSRTDLYGEHDFAEYRRAYQSPEKFRAYLYKHDVNLVLLRNAPYFIGLVDDLNRSDGWKLKLVTPRNFLFQKMAARERKIQPIKDQL